MKELNKAEAIAKAEAAVEKSYNSKPEGRRWLIGHAPDSYGDLNYRTSIHVLEGSPPKGYVVVFGHASCGKVMAFDCMEHRIGTWEWRD